MKRNGITNSGIRRSNDSNYKEVKWETAKTVGDWLKSHELDTPQSRMNLLDVLTSNTLDPLSEQPGPSLIKDALYGKAEFQPWSLPSERIIDSVLSKLWFPEMFDRQERITETFGSTFQWIFREPHDPAKPWDSFTSWLTNGSGIYWITGKAGSGKSTLMKMLCDSQKTRTLLGEWTGDTAIVTAEFYFWNSGSALQMSQEGLLRSVLGQAFKQRLMLPSHLLRRKLQAFAISGGSLGGVPLEWKGLLQLFRFLVEEEDQQVNYFFLLDGLDEFAGDQSKLVSLIHTLGAYPNVKVCVSSRPYNVFEDGFRQQPSLMLQYLTFDDILLYVGQNLANEPAFHELAWSNPEEAKQLVHSVSTKASGVFLWVILAVRSLVKGLMDGDRVRDLKGRLDEMPAELEELFKKMLHSLEGRYFSDAARLFRIYRESQQEAIGFDRGLPLMALDFADEADFESTADLRVKPLTGKEWYMRSTSMKRRLNSRCKGLIEIEHPKRSTGTVWNIKEVDRLVSEAESGEASALPTLHAYGRDLARTKIQYLHRTVKDYLESPTVLGIIEHAKAEDEVSPDISLHLSNIWLWKTFEDGTDIMMEYTTPTATFRTRLGRCLNSALVYLRKDRATYCKMLDIIGGALFGPDTATLVARQRLGITSPVDDFLSLAVHCNLFEYVTEKLRQLRLRDPSLSNQCSRLLQIAVSKATALKLTEIMPELDFDMESNAEADTDPGNKSDGDNNLNDEWVRFRGRDGPSISMVKILLRHGADPYFAIGGTYSRQIVIQRLYEPGCPFYVELRKILTVFDSEVKETIASPSHWIEKGKNFFNEKKRKNMN